jgi:DNA-binding NarL/FixJ family response regulator
MRTLYDRIVQLTSARPNVRILVTGADMDREEVILKALVLGAKGCVDETLPAEEFVKAVQVVHQGLVWAPRRVCSSFIDVFTSHTPLRVPDRSGPVTDREHEVLQLLILGKSNGEIGEALAFRSALLKHTWQSLCESRSTQSGGAVSPRNDQQLVPMSQH